MVWMLFKLRCLVESFWVLSACQPPWLPTAQSPPASNSKVSCFQHKNVSKPCQFMSPLCGATQGRNTLSHFDSSRPIGAKTGETRRAAVYTHPFQAVTLAAITGRQLDQPQQIQAPCNIHAIALRECLAPTLPARWTAERNSQSVVLLA